MANSKHKDSKNTNNRLSEKKRWARRKRDGPKTKKYVFSNAGLFETKNNDEYIFSAAQMLGKESSNYLGNYVFTELQRNEWSRETQYIPSHDNTMPRMTVLASVKIYQARIEFARIERSYYGYWMSRIGCEYSGWNANLQSFVSEKCLGCRECQEQTYNRLTNIVPPIKYWEIVRVKLPSHHAVAVYEKGKRIQEGFIFDPWPEQAPRVYKYDEWPFTTKFLVKAEK